VAHGDRLADIRDRGWGHSLLSEIPRGFGPPRHVLEERA
jgi:hypothetical protein